MTGRPGLRPRAFALAIVATLFSVASLPCLGQDRGGASGSRSAGDAFAFALIGDVPSFPLEVRMVERILASLDEDIAFAIHVGDLKGGSERCDDPLLAGRRDLLDRSPVPLFFTPGDNDWTDCHRERAGGFDPLERLAALRERFFARAEPLGKGGREAAPYLALERQAELSPGGPPENLRWRLGAALFVTINLPGSGNAREVEKLRPGSGATRDGWNERWLRESYAMAEREGFGVIVVVGHANPGFGNPRAVSHAAFKRMLEGLSSKFAGQTLFLHGDTHRHSVERLAERLLRVESHGSPFSDRWVRIEIEPAAPQPVRVRSRQVDPDPAAP